MVHDNFVFRTAITLKWRAALIAVLTCLTTAVYADAEEVPSTQPHRPTISQIFCNIQKAYDAIPPYTATVEKVRTETLAGVTTENYIESSYAWDRTRLDIRRFYGNIRDGQKVPYPTEDRERYLWTGDQFYARFEGISRETKKPYLSIEVGSGLQYVTQYLGDRETGFIFHGYVMYGMPVTRLLAESYELNLQEEPALINDAPCYLFTGKGRWGSFQIWIDRQTFLLRQSILDQSTSDLYRDFYQPATFSFSDGTESTIETYQIRVDNVRYETIEGIPCAVSGTLTETGAFPDHPPRIMKSRITQTHRTFNPDFTKLNFFALDDMLAGAPVKQRETRSYSLRKYVLENNQIKEVSSVRPIEESKSSKELPPCPSPVPGLDGKSLLIALIMFVLCFYLAWELFFPHTWIPRRFFKNAAHVGSRVPMRLPSGGISDIRVTTCRHWRNLDTYLCFKAPVEICIGYAKELLPEETLRQITLEPDPANPLRIRYPSSADENLPKTLKNTNVADWFYSKGSRTLLIAEGRSGSTGTISIQVDPENGLFYCHHHVD